MDEIATELDGKVDCLFVATGTCGTLRGCAEYVRDHHLGTRIFAVDAHGSVIFGGKPAKRLIPGHGSARRPELYRADLADECLRVDRKSTRLNSSHRCISYAVFCLKKKTNVLSEQVAS